MLNLFWNYEKKREYTKSRTKYEFAKNKQLSDQSKLGELIRSAEQDLEMIKRQVNFLFAL